MTLLPFDAVHFLVRHHNNRIIDMSGLSHSDYPEYVPGMGGVASTKVMGFGTRPVLIMVDVCKGYFDGSSPINLVSYNLAAKAPQSMIRLLDTAHNSKTPVIWTQTKYTNGKDAKLLREKNPALNVFMHGDQRKLSGYLDDMPRPKAGMNDVIMYRKYPSAFLGTNLSTILAALGVDTIIICGARTSGSIRMTAVDAMQGGYRPMVSDLMFALAGSRHKILITLSGRCVCMCR